MSLAVARAFDTGGLVAGAPCRGADRRARPGEPRRGRCLPRGDRIAGGEFLRRRRRAGALVRAPGVAGAARLQGDQHRRLHDRPPDAAPSRLRLGGGAARRSRQPARQAGSRAADRPRRAVGAGGAAGDALRIMLADARQAPLAERRLAGGGHGRCARARAGRSAPLSRRARRRPVAERRRTPPGGAGRHPRGACASMSVPGRCSSRWFRRWPAPPISFRGSAPCEPTPGDASRRSMSRCVSRCAASASSVASIIAS